MVKIIPGMCTDPALRPLLERLIADANGPEGRADADRVAGTLRVGVRAHELARRRSMALIGIPRSLKGTGPRFL